MQCSIKCVVKATVASVALLGLGAALQQADAGCLQYQPPKKVASSWQTPGEFFGSQRLVKVDDWGQSFYHAEIVGLWAFKYTSKGNEGTLGIPDGAPIDGGNTLWFADGNEVTYSGVRDPMTGAVCLGVWKQTGEHTYELNHIGLSWDPTTHEPGGPAFIKQYVTLAKDGKTYTGTFTINQLKPDGKTPALPAEIKGTIEATRVTLSTDTQVP
jgi:hypothetical protein